MKKNNKIIFTTDIEGLYEQEDLHPQPAINYMPDWYKNLPTDIKRDNTFISKVIPNMKTVKLCPSFAEVFREGYVMLAPCDYYFRLEKNGYWNWQTPDTEIKCDVHEDEQFIQHINNKVAKKVFKLINPWYGITPKGWSIRQVPLFYDFNEDWQIAYGILNTDVEHELNQQLIYTSKSNEIFIKRGTPLNYIVPFNRKEKLQHEIKPINKELRSKIMKSKRLVRSGFKASVNYYKKS